MLPKRLMANLPTSLYSVLKIGEGDKDQSYSWAGVSWVITDEGPLNCLSSVSFSTLYKCFLHLKQQKILVQQM